MAQNNILFMSATEIAANNFIFFAITLEEPIFFYNT